MPGSGAGIGPTGFARCQIDVSTPGRVKLTLNSAEGLSVWVDGTAVEPHPRRHTPPEPMGQQLDVLGRVVVLAVEAEGDVPAVGGRPPELVIHPSAEPVELAAQRLDDFLRREKRAEQQHAKLTQACAAKQVGQRREIVVQPLGCLAEVFVLGDLP